MITQGQKRPYNQSPHLTDKRTYSAHKLLIKEFWQQEKWESKWILNAGILELSSL